MRWDDNEEPLEIWRFVEEGHRVNSYLKNSDNVPEKPVCLKVNAALQAG